ncbi:MAG: DUF5615 family PIN-like protein [Nocardioidaceae bacterium]
MDFLADENIPIASVRRLREAGHDVVAVTQESPGIPDDEVLTRAVREERVLLTFDSDYGQLVYGPENAHAPRAGIVYFRFVPTHPDEPAEHLLGVVKEASLPLTEHLTVVERGRIRQRPLGRSHPRD